MIKVAFFDAKAYDKPSFEHYGSERDMQFRFLETKLNLTEAFDKPGWIKHAVFTHITDKLNWLDI